MKYMLIMRATDEAQAVEAVWPIESARIVGTLARFTGDFALAEDLAQEALTEALVAWPRDGVPYRAVVHDHPCESGQILPPSQG